MEIPFREARCREPNDQPAVDIGADGFDRVIGERCATVPVSMKDAEAWVQPGTSKGNRRKEASLVSGFVDSPE